MMFAAEHGPYWDVGLLAGFVLATAPLAADELTLTVAPTKGTLADVPVPVTLPAAHANGAWRDEATGTVTKDGARVGVVVGGGLLGLEAANALKSLGLEAHVVEFAPQLMAVQLDAGGGALLRRKIEALGVGVHTGRNTREIVDGETCRHRMQFADGGHLEADLIVFSAGIRPRDELARACGLDVGERGGIVVDDQCRTSDPDIYAIGECALWGGRIYGLVAPGYAMAKAAAADLTGTDGAFTGADMSTKLKLLGVDVGSIGDAHAKTPGALCYTYQDDLAGVYKKIVVDGDGRRLLGAVLVGDAADYGNLLQFRLRSTVAKEANFFPNSFRNLAFPNLREFLPFLRITRN